MLSYNCKKLQKSALYLGGWIDMDEENNQPLENKGKLIKLIIVVNIFLLIAVGGFISYQFFNKKFADENEALKNVVREEIVEVEANKSAKETLSEIKAIESIEKQEAIVKDYDFVHQMSNNLIVASDGQKWGEQAVTLDNIDLGIEMLANDGYIVAELNKWKDGNFENAIDLHNYCWEILEGDTGKASSIYQEGIDAALKAVGKE